MTYEDPDAFRARIRASVHERIKAALERKQTRDQARKAFDETPTADTARALLNTKADVWEHIDARPAMAAGLRKLAASSAYCEAYAARRRAEIECSRIYREVTGSNEPFL